MLSTLDIVTDIGIMLCSIAAVSYGYWRWRTYRQKKDKLWYLIGAIMFLGVAWDYAIRFLLPTIDYQTVFWSRNILAVVIVVACIAVYKRFKLD
jgi:hypothetical protein